MVLAGAAAAAGAVSAGAADAPALSSQVFDWETMSRREPRTGVRRDIVQARTATLDELEIHITTLNPGQEAHPPHEHPAEELLIIKEGTVESLVNGERRRIGAGSIVFQASNQLHTIRNVGAGPATYHVIQWQSPGMRTP